MPAIDPLAGLDAEYLQAPITGGEAITPHASNEFAKVSRAIYIGGGGDAVVICPDGTSLTFVALPAGTLLPIRAKRVAAASTTATSMLALW